MANAPFFVIWWGFVLVPRYALSNRDAEGWREAHATKLILFGLSLLREQPAAGAGAGGEHSSTHRHRGSPFHPSLEGETRSYLQLVPVLLDPEGEGELLLGSWLPSQCLLGLFALWLQFPAGIPSRSHPRMPTARTVLQADSRTGEEESTGLGITGNCWELPLPTERAAAGTCRTRGPVVPSVVPARSPGELQG